MARPRVGATLWVILLIVGCFAPSHASGKAKDFIQRVYDLEAIVTRVELSDNPGDADYNLVLRPPPDPSAASRFIQLFWNPSNTDSGGTAQLSYYRSYFDSMPKHKYSQQCVQCAGTGPTGTGCKLDPTKPYPANPCPNLFRCGDCMYDINRHGHAGLNRLLPEAEIFFGSGWSDINDTLRNGMSKLGMGGCSGDGDQCCIERVWNESSKRWVPGPRAYPNANTICGKLVRISGWVTVEAQHEAKPEIHPISTIAVQENPKQPGKWTVAAFIDGSHGPVSTCDWWDWILMPVVCAVVETTSAIQRIWMFNYRTMPDREDGYPSNPFIDLGALQPPKGRIDWGTWYQKGGTDVVERACSVTPLFSSNVKNTQVIQPANPERCQKLRISMYRSAKSGAAWIASAKAGWRRKHFSLDLTSKLDTPGGILAVNPLAPAPVRAALDQSRGLRIFNVRRVGPATIAGARRVEAARRPTSRRAELLRAANARRLQMEALRRMAARRRMSTSEAARRYRAMVERRRAQERRAEAQRRQRALVLRRRALERRAEALRRQRALVLRRRAQERRAEAERRRRLVEERRAKQRQRERERRKGGDEERRREEEIRREREQREGGDEERSRGRERRREEQRERGDGDRAQISYLHRGQVAPGGRFGPFVVAKMLRPVCEVRVLGTGKNHQLRRWYRWTITPKVKAPYEPGVKLTWRVIKRPAAIRLVPDPSKSDPRKTGAFAVWLPVPEQLSPAMSQTHSGELALYLQRNGKTVAWDNVALRAPAPLVRLIPSKPTMTPGANGPVYRLALRAQSEGFCGKAAQLEYHWSRFNTPPAVYLSWNSPPKNQKPVPPPPAGGSGPAVIDLQSGQSHTFSVWVTDPWGVEQALGTRVIAPPRLHLLTATKCEDTRAGTAAVRPSQSASLAKILAIPKGFAIGGAAASKPVVDVCRTVTVGAITTETKGIGASFPSTTGWKLSFQWGEFKYANADTGNQWIPMPAAWWKVSHQAPRSRLTLQAPTGAYYRYQATLTVTDQWGRKAVANVKGSNDFSPPQRIAERLRAMWRLMYPRQPIPRPDPCGVCRHGLGYKFQGDFARLLHRALSPPRGDGLAIQHLRNEVASFTHQALAKASMDRRLRVRYRLPAAPIFRVRATRRPWNKEVQSTIRVQERLRIQRSPALRQRLRHLRQIQLQRASPAARRIAPALRRIAPRLQPGVRRITPDRRGRIQ